jgi:hypothetical protein
MTQALRRVRSRIAPVDIAHFRPQVDTAMQAFQSDVSYAVLMARAAVTIVRKREVWQARRDARNSDGASL